MIARWNRRAVATAFDCFRGLEREGRGGVEKLARQARLACTGLNSRIERVVSLLVGSCSDSSPCLLKLAKRLVRLEDRY